MDLAHLHNGAVNAVARRFRPIHPSFRAKLEEAKRIKALASSHYLHLSEKTAGKDLAVSLGVGAPAVLATADRVADLDWAALPDRFVVKPRVGAASRGVFLVATRDGRRVDLVRGTPVTSDDVAREVERWAAKVRYHSTAVVVEELIAGPDGLGADDWKLYAFHGRVGLVLQRRRRDRGSAQLKFYDPDWRPLGNIRRGTRVTPALDPPRLPGALVDAAERLSAAVPAPFVRVDLFERGDRVVFGEITPIPGGAQWFVRRWDRDLGALWEDAEARLRIERGDARPA